MKKSKKKNIVVIRNIILSVLMAIAILVVVGGAIYVSDYYKPMNEALEALKDSSNVTVSTSEKLILFTPKNQVNETGLIYYPGGKVDFRAYAPTAKAIAEKGYLVAIPKMTLNLAILSPNKANGIIKNHSEIKKWVITGHSLGGVMASDFARRNSDKINGLIFLASYPLKDMSKVDMKSIMIYGTYDGFTTVNDYQQKGDLMPINPVIYPLEGANHSNFGYYGFQKGDKEAKITRENQQNQIVEKIVEFLDSLQ